MKIESNFIPSSKFKSFLILFCIAVFLSPKIEGQKQGPLTEEEELRMRLFAELREAVQKDNPKELARVYKKESDPKHLIGLFTFTFQQAIHLKKMNSIRFVLKTEYIKSEDYLKGTSLLLSMQISSPEIATLILESGLNPNVKAKDAHGNDPFLISVDKGYPSLVRLFIRSGIDLNRINDSKRNALMIAVGNSNLEITKILLEQKSSDIIQRDAVGSNALHIAASCNEDLRKKIEIPEIVTIFLKLGLDPNSRTDGGTTPLMLAALYDCTESLKILLNHKADPNLQNFEGQTAIFWAATNGNLESIKTLAPIIQNINLQDRSGKSPIMYTIERGHKDSYYFLKPLSNLQLVTKSNESTLMLSIICEDFGPSAFSMGLNSEYEIENCESIYPKCSRDSFRIYNRYYSTPDPELLSNLLEAGLDVNHKDIRGETAIFRAAICGEREYINLLLKKKAKTNLKNLKGKTPADFAKEWKHENILDLLNTK